MARGWTGRTRILERSGSGGTAGCIGARRIRRPWRGLPARNGRNRPAGEARSGGLCRIAAQHRDPALSRAPWHRRAEKEVSAKAGKRGTGQRDSHDRARRRVRSAERHHDCAEGWERLSHQRRENLHLQRPDRGLHHRRRQDRSQ